MRAIGDRPRLIEPQQVCPMIPTGFPAIKRDLSPTYLFWMNLQISYDLKIARKNMAKIENEIIPQQQTATAR